MTIEPYRIDAVVTPSGAKIGLGHCPGRCGGSYGQRDLGADLDAIETWGANVLVSLVETREFARLGVPAFETAARTRSFQWHHVPVVDFGTPDAATRAAWDVAAPVIAHTLTRGGKVMLHCAAGLGRTGTIAGKLLVDAGMTANDAIAAVRQARPGTIETAAQLAYVRSGAQLLCVRPQV